MASPVVCVVGGGTAGLEGLLAARAELGAAAELVLIAPEREFRYRPMSRDSLFAPAGERALPISELAAQVDATWIRDRVAAVHEPERGVLTRDGDTVDFDFLLLAVGARSERALRQGYLWLRGADPAFLDQIIEEIGSGAVRSVAIAVPRGARWPIPAYELALVLAWTARGTGTQVTLATAEDAPLGVLGPAATDAVRRELDAAGVETIAGVELVEPESDADGRVGETPDAGPAHVILLPEDPSTRAQALTGRPTEPATVHPHAGRRRSFDRLISLPTVRGPYLPGVATDAAGFIEVDAALQVCGNTRVWAAGRCIAAALEHSALSARQADAAIAEIAARLDGGGPPGRDGPELAGILLSGQREQWMAENPHGIHEPSTRCLWWPPGRAVGQRLARLIAAWDPSTHDGLPINPGGVVIRAPVALGCSKSASTERDGEVSAEIREARLRDIAHRQLMAVRRREHEADSELRTLRKELETFANQEQRVATELRQHGYLRDRGHR